MKTPEEWVEDLKDHPDCKFPSTTLMSMDFCKALVEAIQRDASDDLKLEVRRLNHNIEVYKERWHQARRYLRAANKGAQRNAEALALCQERYWDLITSDNRLKERDLNNHKTIVWNWLLMSDDEYRLKFGELSAQDLRNIRAVLKAMLETSLLKHL